MATITPIAEHSTTPITTSKVEKRGRPPGSRNNNNNNSKKSLKALKSPEPSSAEEVEIEVEAAQAGTQTQTQAQTQSDLDPSLTPIPSFRYYVYGEQEQVTAGSGTIRRTSLASASADDFFAEWRELPDWTRTDRQVLYVYRLWPVIQSQPDDYTGERRTNNVCKYVGPPCVEMTDPLIDVPNSVEQFVDQWGSGKYLLILNDQLVKRPGRKHNTIARCFLTIEDLDRHPPNIPDFTSVVVDAPQNARYLRWLKMHNLDPQTIIEQQEQDMALNGNGGINDAVTQLTGTIERLTAHRAPSAPVVSPPQQDFAALLAGVGALVSSLHPQQQQQQAAPAERGLTVQEANVMVQQALDRQHAQFQQAQAQAQQHQQMMQTLLETVHRTQATGSEAVITQLRAELAELRTANRELVAENHRILTQRASPDKLTEEVQKKVQNDFLDRINGVVTAADEELDLPPWMKMVKSILPAVLPGMLQSMGAGGVGQSQMPMQMPMQMPVQMQMPMQTQMPVQPQQFHSGMPPQQQQQQQPHSQPQQEPITVMSNRTPTPTSAASVPPPPIAANPFLDYYVVQASAALQALAPSCQQALEQGVSGADFADHWVNGANGHPLASSHYDTVVGLGREKVFGVMVVSLQAMPEQYQVIWQFVQSFFDAFEEEQGVPVVTPVVVPVVTPVVTPAPTDV